MTPYSHCLGLGPCLQEGVHKIGLQFWLPLFHTLLLGVVVQERQIPEAIKWQCMLPDAKNQIEDEISQGWDVLYCDGSWKCTSGLSHAGFGVCLGEGDHKKGDRVVPMQEKVHYKSRT